MLATWTAGPRCIGYPESAFPRRITQLASRQAYEAGCAGIYYLSRYGHDLENWAIFEPFPIRPGESRAISPDDENFLKALDILGLKLSTT